VSASSDGIPFVGHSPPATALVVWALLYPVVMLAGAILTFSRRDL
jgi:hypothetical protein